MNPITYLASPNHSPRNGATIDLIVMHATAGPFRSSLDWLRNPQPSAPDARVSAHYLIGIAGDVVQLVTDDMAAWHAGKSAWGGRGSATIQAHSIGVELVNLNTGHDPYPLAQLDSARALCRMLIGRYAIGRANVVRHSDIAIPKGRKTDPAGFPDWPAFVASLYAPVPERAIAPLSSDALLLHAPRATQAQCVAWLCRGATGGYTRYDVSRIVALYFAHAGGIDPVLAIAQMAHETGNLSSWWSQRPRRNPAGIGVTGIAGAGLHFASWDLSVPAHTGRLLAYALLPDKGTAAQKRLIDSALDLRPLPARYRGCAARLAGLENTWAVPGLGYAGKLAAIATAMRGMP